MSKQYTPKNWEEFDEWSEGDSGNMKKEYNMLALEQAIRLKRNYDIQVNADMVEMSWEVGNE